MIWILATRGASIRERNAPFTETPILGVQSVIYRPGITPVPDNSETALPGTFARGLHRISGFVFAHDGQTAETLLGVTAPVDLVIRYRANTEPRMRTLLDVIFIGDATVTFPARNSGETELIGAPFRVQIPEGNTLADHVIDQPDS